MSTATASPADRAAKMLDLARDRAKNDARGIGTVTEAGAIVTYTAASRAYDVGTSARCLGRGPRRSVAGVLAVILATET